MSAIVAEEPLIVHTAPGRLRVHVPGWSGQGERLLETQLRQVQGVRRVQANPLTGNVLLLFDAQTINEAALFHIIQNLDLTKLAEQPSKPEMPHAAREKQGKTVRARIAVRGLDRDPQVAKRVVTHLEKRPGVRAHANPLTGRVLIEFTEHEADLDDLLAEIADLELPNLPGEDRPAYPLDPAPLLQGAMRALGSGLGLALLTTRRLAGLERTLPAANVAAYAAAIIGIFQGLPPVRYGLRRLLGRPTADLLFNIPAIITLTLSGNTLGLALSGAEALQLFTEVRARQIAWRQHEERIAALPHAQQDAILRLENGERVPLPAEVLEGSGTASGRDGIPLALAPGSLVPSGARVYGGPFALKLQREASFEAFQPQARPAPPRTDLYEHYQRIQAPIGLGFAALTALFTRSASATLAALLLVNPRTAAIGVDNADLAASAWVLRTGVTIVGTRPERTLRRPDLLLFDGVRLLTDRLEVINILPLTTDMDASEVQARAAGVASAAGSPWGNIFRTTRGIAATRGSFDGKTATAFADEVCYRLGPLEDWSITPEAARLRQRGNYLLALSCEEGEERETLALLALRPRLVSGLPTLIETCRRHGVELAFLSSGDQLAIRELAHRTQLPFSEQDDALAVIAARQQEGARVAFVSDSSTAAAAFAACDLAIGLTDDRSRFPARADLLAPDLVALSAIIEASARREAVARDSVGLSVVSNIAGIFWGLRGIPGVGIASRAVHITALGTLADSWLRLRGGAHARSPMTRLVDPHPERWGRREVPDVLRVLRTGEQGLSNSQARARWQKAPAFQQGPLLGKVLLDQLRSPLIGILAAGAALSLWLGSTGDVVIIAATISVNVLIGAWQERKANRVAETLRRIGISQARVLRANQPTTLPASEVVPGDILLLSPGASITADARVIESAGLEIDEAALTGESLPVAKYVDQGSEVSRIVLEGSDVTAGNGRAAVFAVGEQTRMGATRRVLLENGEEQSPLGTRLSRMLSFFLPVSALGGAIVIFAGWRWGKPLSVLLATGASIALAGVPEGLPLLSRVGEAGVARRLAEKRAIVRRLSSIEALGRVDTVCTDKTGTMTRGRLQLSVVADAERETNLMGPLPEQLRPILLAAALASPHPAAHDAHAHPTDAAVIQGALAAGLETEIQQPHLEELSFDPVRSFHATRAQGRLSLKGAPEVVLPRCQTFLRNGERVPLDEEARATLLTRAYQLAERGLRVLMAAEGGEGTSLQNPRGLTALGFVGINDPLRPTVKGAVERCHKAGVRVIMITGDHPATARAIAQEAGLLQHKDQVINAIEIADLQNGELDQRLQGVVVVARTTPLDKLRIIESLQRQGHIVAMTGDGVNDAPALRLADVGVAMGKTGTEVARQTADVVITDDDFSTLVEGFVEGRSFWRNMRRALGLLLGGNLGELGLVVGASVLGTALPLTVSQILAVNAITDILPALAVIFQQPEHRNLASLQREGISALDAPLRNEVLRRGLATALPSLAAYLLALRNGSLAQARSVAFTSVVSTQLAQTLLAGRIEGHLTGPVLAAVGGSFGLVLTAFSVPTLRNLLQLAVLPPSAWALIGGGALGAVLLNALLSEQGMAQASALITSRESMQTIGVR